MEMHDDILDKAAVVRGFLFVVILILLLATLLSTCGDDDDESPQPVAVVPEDLGSWTEISTPAGYSSIITMCYDGVRIFMARSGDSITAVTGVCANG